MFVCWLHLLFVIVVLFDAVVPRSLVLVMIVVVVVVVWHLHLRCAISLYPYINALIPDHQHGARIVLGASVDELTA